MLIIFDLDDTLIDTSGCVTPFQFKKSLRILGLEEKFEELIDLNERLARGYLAIEALGKLYGCRQKLIDKAIEELSSPLPSKFMISTTPGANEILDYYRSLATIVLVTAGKPSFQEDKLEKAGLDRAIFSMMAVSEKGDKRPFYQEAVKKFLSSSAWVCGDRVESDLLPAHELGLKTVHFRWGRGRQEAKAPWVDYSIETLYELKGIIR